MQISQNGINLIAEFEGFSATAYKDPGSKDGLPITIGYGTTKIDGKLIKLSDKITKERAMELLKEHVNDDYAPSVELALAGVDLNQNEFDAVVSLVYNIGLKAFNKSTVKRMLIKGDRTAAAEAFGMWIKNDGKVLAGLVRRRAAEKTLFLKPVKKTTVTIHNTDAPSEPLEGTLQGQNKPESSLTPQTTDKPLVTSREIAGGVIVGGSSIGQFVSAVNVDDLVSSKKGLEDLKTSTSDAKSEFIFSSYAIQGLSILIFLVGVFIIWKRFKDRKEGKR